MATAASSTAEMAWTRSPKSWMRRGATSSMTGWAVVPDTSSLIGRASGDALESSSPDVAVIV